MYWTHLIFALVLGLVHLSQWTYGTKPGYLDFDNLPETNFSCEGKVIGGYYADVETGCQMFHVCTIGQKAEVTDIKFLCLNGTVFDQETRVCERIDEVDCSKSEDFFGLNLELYGNNGNLGIQPENEFECEDCGTEDYDVETTTTTTTTTPKPTTTVATTTTTTQPPKAYPASSPETFAALLALHNAFQESFHAKVKPPPPRVINNAFQTTKPPYPKIEYLHQPPRQKPIYQPTTPLPKANYHHFSSSDASFGHSFDQEKPYNFQFFHARKLEEPQKEVSVVTSTSTSTSVRTSKNLTDYDYEDLDFYDVPKIRQKREEKHSNHRYPDEHTNHNYYKKNETRENFLKNLLNSIDMEDKEREKMVNFFITEEKEMDNGGMLSKLGHKLGEIIMEDVNKTIQQQNDSFDLDELSRLWKLHYEEMSQEVNLDFNVDNKLRVKRDLKERPVFEEVDEGDFTTTPYRRVAQKQRTTSRPVKSIRFNYETSKNPPEPLEAEGELTKWLTTSNYPAINRRTTTRPSRKIKTTRNQNDGPRESVRPKPTKTSVVAFEDRDSSRDIKRPRSGNSDAPESRKRVKISRHSINDGNTSATDSDSSRDFKRPSRNGGDTSESLKQRVKTITRPTHGDISEADGDSLKDNIETIRPHSGSDTSASVRQRVKILRPTNSDDEPEYDDSLRKTISRPVHGDVSEEPNLRMRVKTSHRPVYNNDEADGDSLKDNIETIRPLSASDTSASVRQRVKIPRPTHSDDEPEYDDSLRKTISRPVHGDVSEEPNLRMRVKTSNRPVYNNDGEAPEAIDSFKPRVQTALPPQNPDGTNQRTTSRPRSIDTRVENPIAQSEVPKKTRSRGHVRGGRITEQVTSTTTIRTSILPDQKPDPYFVCEGKVKGGFYADIVNDCRGFFICSQGQINGPLLKSHFWCGATTKFNQRSRTCQAENLVECSISARYFHLNNDFLVPESESDLKGTFEPMRVKN